MHLVKKYRYLLGIFLITTVFDSVARLYFAFDMHEVVRFEAALFAFATLALLIAARSDGKEFRSVRKADHWAALCFALASLRALIWSLGNPVYTANLIILIIGVAAIGWAVLRVRLRGHEKY